MDRARVGLAAPIASAITHGSRIDGDRVAQPSAHTTGRSANHKPPDPRRRGSDHAVTMGRSSKDES
jgi:hypothetical protein